MSWFRSGGGAVSVRVAPGLAPHRRHLQAEVHEDHGGGGRARAQPRLPLHLLRQPVAPSLHQADHQPGSFAKFYIYIQR